ncbi:heat-shock protein Hsp20 [Rhizorhabdus wittichii DC-6]|nr:heat-shock protein Hsp20 [Rhizorhabdus wittichii DC-6]
MNDVVSPARTARSPMADGGPVGWLRTEIDRLFDDFGRPGRSLFDFGPRALQPLPAIEMTETEAGYKVTAELPGIAQGDINLELADGLLSISGEKKAESEKKDNGCLVSERRYGSFHRQITVPADVDPDGITASFRDGVLTVDLAKDRKAAARTRKIKVEA